MRDTIPRQEGANRCPRRPGVPAFRTKLPLFSGKSLCRLPIAFWCRIWYTNNAKRERTLKGSTLSAMCKVVKKVNFPLDTKHKVCYNKYVNKGCDQRKGHSPRKEYIMTTREFLVAVQNANISDELNTKAQELITSLDKRNDKRKSVESKEKKETAERRQKVLDFLKNNEGAFTRDEIAEGCELTAGQVTSACSALCKAELVTKSEIKVDKARKVAYAIK